MKIDPKSHPGSKQTTFGEQSAFEAICLLNVVRFCNQNDVITLIITTSVIKVIIPFWLQKGTKIEKTSSKIFFLESVHSQLSKTVLRMFIRPLAHILRLNEVW